MRARAGGCGGSTYQGYLHLQPRERALAGRVRQAKHHPPPQLNPADVDLRPPIRARMLARGACAQQQSRTSLKLKVAAPALNALCATCVVRNNCPHASGGDTPLAQRSAGAGTRAVRHTEPIRLLAAQPPKFPDNTRAWISPRAHPGLSLTCAPDGQLPRPRRCVQYARSHFVCVLCMDPVPIHAPS